VTYGFVLVGMSNIAHAHAEAIAAVGDRARLVGAVDIDAERLAAFGAKYGVPFLHTDYADALAVDADAVIPCTPPMQHREQAVAAIERSLTVFCEKPPALSLADLDAFIAAAKTSKGRFAAVFQQRYGGGAQLRVLLAEGVLGRPTVAVCHTLWFLDAVDDGTTPPVSSLAARNTLELTAAIYASVFERRLVFRGEVDPTSPYYRRSMAGEGAPWAAKR
jgi:predicted dehydrogenase